MNCNHHNTKEIRQNSNCTCGEKCLCCSAEKLTVNCGCGMESKQFEFNLEHSCCHTEHDKKVSITAPSDGEVYYTCPMHPEVVKSAPGKCSGCGMDLIPQKQSADDHAGHDMQKMSARQSPGDGASYMPVRHSASDGG